VGFIGVLIVTNPGADSLQVGTLFALGKAVMYGSVTGALRGMMATESATTLLMWQMVTIAVFPLFPADVRFLLAGAARHRNARMLRRRQRDRDTPI
jgi:drug/metabolite transporter (DMT)-like permease